jgi:hypothetical protein
MDAFHPARRYPAWALPAFSLLLGVLLLGAFWIGGDALAGLAMFSLMAAAAAALALGGRSETVRLIRQPDERWSAIDLRASAFSGLVIITVLIGLFLWEIATDGDPSAYSAIMAAGGVAYVAALAVLRRRS